MELFFLSQKLLHRLFVHLIGYTTVHRADSRTLGLLMKTLAFCTFVRNDIVDIHADGSIALTGIYNTAIQERKRSLYTGAIGDRPFHSALVNGVIRAFRLASAAVDTFFCYFNSHILKIRE